MKAVTNQNLEAVLSRVISKMRFTDIHTHLFTPGADNYWLSGITNLLNYHYAYREHLGWRRDITPDEFWSMNPEERARDVWNTHFVRGNKGVRLLPVSEGMRAILTILSAFGFDVNHLDLKEVQQYFSSQDPFEHTDKVLKLAGIKNVIGTNNPFDEGELEFYQSRKEWHPAFSAALRLDDLVLTPEKASRYLRDRMGYKDASHELNENSIKGLRGFMSDWLDPATSILPRVNYVGISFPHDFPWTDSQDTRVKILDKVVIPACREFGISLFLMPEPYRQLEPGMKNAGDFLGKMDCVEFGKFAQQYTEVDIWVSPLNYSSQYEMSALSCVLPHVKPWSTWWYNHQPGLTQQLLNMRLEMNGSNSFLFNSDARVLEHLISKWWHFKEELKTVLATQVSRLLNTGYQITEDDIENWISTLFDERRLRRREWSKVLSRC